MTTMTAMLGHNVAGLTITVEVRLFNSLKDPADRTGPRRMELPAGSVVGDVMDALTIPANRVFLVLKNGRDVTPALNGGINRDHPLEDGDVLALSGPVPYSWGYGAPVV